MKSLILFSVVLLITFLSVLGAKNKKQSDGNVLQPTLKNQGLLAVAPTEQQREDPQWERLRWFAATPQEKQAEWIRLFAENVYEKYGIKLREALLKVADIKPADAKACAELLTSDENKIYHAFLEKLSLLLGGATFKIPENLPDWFKLMEAQLQRTFQGMKPLEQQLREIIASGRAATEKERNKTSSLFDTWALRQFLQAPEPLNPLD